MYSDIRLTVFAPQDGTMALPHPLVSVLPFLLPNKKSCNLSMSPTNLMDTQFQNHELMVMEVSRDVFEGEY